MSKKIDFISPIAIDLGAKNTGVYFAHYPSGISLLDDEKFKKSGKVYQLEKDSYTLLMANRTAKRHQKRGYDRRQMAKRLFKLIWEKHFGLVWDKDVQQTISFLLNRRGFTFLTEEYDEEKLSQFPKTAYDLLPEELKKDVEKHGDGYDFDIALKEWVKNPDKIKNLYQELEVKIYLEKLRQACNQIQKGNYKSRKNDLSKVNKSLLDKMRKKGVQGLNDAALSGKYKWTNKRGENKELPFIYDDNINIEEYLKNNKEKIQTIKNSLPKLRQAELKSSVWSFSPESFNLEEFNLPDNENESEKRSKKFNKQSKSAGKGNNGYLKTHLHHLSFALYKTYSELGSGGRHRSKYFEEVEEVLSCQNHSHGYLKNFCKHLHQAPDFDT